ncbi:MAG TPA: acetyl-CoA carboxylase biotin carboxyl carrier protein subunit [Clostridiaceae bacterium]|nr:acetyl-CoA carboxylase biotin carboxyl carrier protein subunit [Clostridiaceae bacterium]
MKYKVSLNGKDYLVEVERGEARMLNITDTPVMAVTAAQTVEEKTTASASLSPATSSSMSGIESEGIKVVSPMPGSVIEVSVNIGDQVQKDQKLCVIEAMKMENAIVAPQAGTVNQIYIETGSKVETSQILIVLI